MSSTEASAVPPEGAQPVAPPALQGGFPSTLYARYERGRGGLLYVLQGLLWIGQGALAQLVRIQSSWSMLWFLPLYLIYFPARRYLWRRLYRPYGHVEHERELKEARFQVWWMLVLGAMIALAEMRGGMLKPVSLPGALVWVAGLWLPVCLWGRIPADLPHQVVHLGFLHGTQRPWPVWLLSAGVMLVGLAQHVLFRRGMNAYRPGGSPDGRTIRAPAAEQGQPGPALEPQS